MHTPRLYDLWKRVFKAREVMMNSWVISHSWLYIKIISMLLNLDWRIVLDGELTRSRLREDYTNSVHTPWTYDLWKHVFTAREVRMNSWVISHSWLYIKIIARLLNFFSSKLAKTSVGNLFFNSSSHVYKSPLVLRFPSFFSCLGPLGLVFLS